MLRARSSSHPALTWTLILLVGALTLAPVLMLLMGSFSEGLGAFGHFTLKKYVAAYTDPFLGEVVGNTLVFVLGSTLLATALALVLAYLNTRTNIPGKSLFMVLSIVPMMIPHLLFAVSWGLLLNPSNGFVNVFLQQLLGLGSAPFNVYTLTGMTIVQGVVILPVAYLIIAPAMQAFDVALEESSRVSGASRVRTLLRVTLPMLRPAILAAMVLGIVQSLAAFSVPIILGMPGQVSVLATYLWQMIAAGIAPDYGKAAALGMSVLVASIGLVVLYRYLTSASEKYATITGRGYRQPTPLALGRARTPLLVAILILSFLIVVLPVLVLLYTSFVPYAMVPSAFAFASMSFAHWIAIWQDPISVLALRNSLFLAVVGATLGVLLSVFVAYVVVRVRTRTAGLLESLTFLSFAFPGIVIGIGFMWFFVRTPLYATLTALLLAYIATYLPFGVRPLASAFAQVHPQLEESSAVSGARFLTTLRRVVVPLVVPGMVSAWILLASMFFRELTVSVVLSRADSMVLSVLVLSYANDGLWGKLSALGIVMIAACTALVLLATVTGRWFQRARTA